MDNPLGRREENSWEKLGKQKMGQETPPTFVINALIPNIKYGKICFSFLTMAICSQYQAFSLPKLRARI